MYVLNCFLSFSIVFYAVTSLYLAQLLKAVDKCIF